MAAEDAVRNLIEGGTTNLADLLRDIGPPELCRISMSFIASQNRSVKKLEMGMANLTDSLQELSRDVRHLECGLKEIKAQLMSREDRRRGWVDSITAGVIQSIVTIIIVGGFLYVAGHGIP